MIYHRCKRSHKRVTLNFFETSTIAQSSCILSLLPCTNHAIIRTTQLPSWTQPFEFKISNKKDHSGGEGTLLACFFLLIDETRTFCTYNFISKSLGPFIPSRHTHGLLCCPLLSELSNGFLKKKLIARVKIAHNALELLMFSDCIINKWFNFPMAWCEGFHPSNIVCLFRERMYSRCSLPACSIRKWVSVVGEIGGCSLWRMSGQE